MHRIAYIPGFVVAVLAVAGCGSSSPSTLPQSASTATATTARTTPLGLPSPTNGPEPGGLATPRTPPGPTTRRGADTTPAPPATSPSHAAPSSTGATTTAAPSPTNPFSPASTTPASTTPASSTPAPASSVTGPTTPAAAPCTLALLGEGAQAVQAGSSIDPTEFGCSGSFAFAGVIDGFAEATSLFVARGGAWIEVPRETYCQNGSVPAAIFQNACESN